MTKNAVYFLRTGSKPQGPKQGNREILCGQVSLSVLPSLKDILNDCYNPLIQARRNSRALHANNLSSRENGARKILTKPPLFCEVFPICQIFYATLPKA